MMRMLLTSSQNTITCYEHDAYFIYNGYVSIAVDKDTIADDDNIENYKQRNVLGPGQQGIGIFLLYGNIKGDGRTAKSAYSRFISIFLEEKKTCQKIWILVIYKNVFSRTVRNYRYVGHGNHIFILNGSLVSYLINYFVNPNSDLHRGFTDLQTL